MAYIGASNLAVFPIAKDDVGVTTYEAIKRLSPLIKATINVKTATAELWGDNHVVEKHFEVTGYDITFETTDLSVEDKALLLGHKWNKEKGMMEVSSNDDAPYFGVAMESKRSDGKPEYLFLTKVKFAPTNLEFETKGENFSYKTPSFTGTGVARISDGLLLLQGTETAKEKWYKPETFKVGE